MKILVVIPTPDSESPRTEELEVSPLQLHLLSEAVICYKQHVNQQTQPAEETIKEELIQMYNGLQWVLKQFPR